MRLLSKTRLLTLSGVGGVGKTRLAIQAAAHAASEYINGVWLVEFGSLFEAQLVAHKTSTALGCLETSGRSRLDTLLDYIGVKTLLLVMDNCEHLVQACADFSSTLLSNCPNLQILATSREALGVPGEVVYEVPPLSLPDIQHPLDQASMANSEAVQLFIERARSFQPAFLVNDQTSAAIVHVCRLLDGIPLAVELAAARVRVLSPMQIAELLQDSLRHLATPNRSAVSRQQTLHASIDWSHSLLNTAERTLFRRLAVFTGRFILDDVQLVCSDGGIPGDEIDSDCQVDRSQTPIASLTADGILDQLASLVDKSLVTSLPGEIASYRLLFPIKLYAQEKLSAAGENEKIRNQHLCHFLELAKRANQLLRSPEQAIWWIRAELELDNFHSALDWSLRRDALETGLQLAGELGEFWYRQGHSAEGLEWLNRLLAEDYPEDTIRARALLHAGRMFRETGDYQQAETYCQKSLELSSRLNFQEGVAEALSILGVVTHYGGDREQALPYLEASLALYEKLGDDWNIAATRLHLADVQNRSGKYSAAEAAFTDSLQYFLEIGDTWGIGYGYGGLADVARFQGDYEKALSLFYEAIKMGDMLDTPFIMEAVAFIFADCGEPLIAARLWGFAEAFRENTHSIIPPIYQKFYEGPQEDIRAGCGKADFDRAWQAGRKLSLEQAVTLANQPLMLDRVTPTKIPKDMSAEQIPDAAAHYDLTPREIEVLRLVAQGMTDANVAEQLVISPRTVSKHLQSIYGKIQVNSRSAATRFALEQKIV